VVSKVNWGHILICDLIHPNSLHLSLTYRINGDKVIKPALSIFKEYHWEKSSGSNPSF